MKIRCLLGMHGPYWTNSSEFLGEYCLRVHGNGFVRICPHCGDMWQGSIAYINVGYGIQVMTFGPWEKVK